MVLTLCILETPKRVLLQIVKTQMKCRIIISAFCIDKKIFRQKNTIFFLIITWHSLIYTMDYPKYIISIQKEESISIQRFTMQNVAMLYQTSIDICNIAGLLDLANAYCEPILKKQCEQIIRHGITVQYFNIAGLLDLANAYCEPILKKQCEQIIRHGITVQ